ncbi:MAG: nucleoside 2-deoxyribosyltransferase domain-containing protein [Patescibacteria group bacterium]|nr:nucleoside 2-deoxyribosyltransferase domain-containing protein [Patescibacteria group bacterium]
MKIFLSYKFTGEKPEELNKNIPAIKDLLEKEGHEVFCTFFDGEEFQANNFSKKQILEHALGYLDNSDLMLVFLNSPEKSEGMLLEIGYAIANKKRFVLAIRKGIKTVFIREFAEKVIEFEVISDLSNKLQKQENQ